ncbi:MAG: hypothetical protein ACOCU4_07930, partial [Alkalispirochaeta sp.]
RAQGFSQTSETTRYLETVSAAWFTGLRVRGVHEVAELPGTARVGLTTFAMDQLPGLVMNITVRRLSDSLPDGIIRQGLLEIPLYDDLSVERTGAILESSGTIRDVAILPQLVERSPNRIDPVEWSVRGVGLRVDLSEASLWIVAAHPGAILPVPFSLGARPIPGGFRVSWYPTGFERYATKIPATSVAQSKCREWSVSYRILATTGDAGSIVSPRVEPDLWDEIDGFTCHDTSP